MFFLLLAFLSYLLFIDPASAQIAAPNCTDHLFAWVGSLCADARFVSIRTHLSHRAGVFMHSRTIRSNKVPAWSQRTWKQNATMAVSTCTFRLVHCVQSYWRVAAFIIPPLPNNQYEYPGPYGTLPAELACECNTVVDNLYSACSACQGSSWLTCVHQLLFSPGFQPTNLPFLFNQLLYVDIQLHHRSTSHNVIPKSFLLAHMLNLPPQLSRAGPRWHARTPVGLHRLVCGYLASGPRLLAQDISSPVPLQIGGNWNISTAEATGGATVRETLLLCTPHIYSSFLIQITPRLREPLLLLRLSPHRQSASPSQL